MKSSFIHEENDLRINQGALDAQLEWKGYGDKVQKKKPSREDLEAFETAYNAACGSIARGELSQAEILLKRAKGRFFYQSKRDEIAKLYGRSLQVVRGPL